MAEQDRPTQDKTERRNGDQTPPPPSGEPPSGRQNDSDVENNRSGTDADGEKDGAKEGRSLPPAVVAGGLGVLALVLIFLAAWGGNRFGYAFTHQSTDDAKIDADTFDITSKIGERVERIFTDTDRFVRRGQLLVTLDDRDERARLAAAVAARNAAAAQVEQARQNLLLTRDQVATESQQSRGDLDSAHANVANAADTYVANARQVAALRATVAQAQAQLRSAIAAVPGARETVTRDAFDLARDSALARTGDVDESDVDADRAAYETAVSNYREAQANVVAARANVANAQARSAAQESQADASAATVVTQRGTVVTAAGRLAEAHTPYRITAQEAALATAQRQLQMQDAQVRLARDQLGYTRIISPLAGAVAAKSIAVGQTIGPGQTLFTIVPAQGLYITANYKETQLNLMRVGQPVDIHIDSYPEFAFVGHVGTFNPASENEYALLPPQNSSGNFVKVTQRVPVRIYLDRGGDAQHPLRPGMSAETYVRVR